MNGGGMMMLGLRRRWRCGSVVVVVGVEADVVGVHVGSTGSESDRPLARPPSPSSTAGRVAASRPDTSLPPDPLLASLTPLSVLAWLLNTGLCACCRVP